MQCLHNLKTSGHLGYFKMYSKATTKFYWQNMCSDIQNYVSSCKLCCQNNTGHDPKVALHSVQVANHPFELIHADILQIHSISN